jgi:hypothetical protein
LRIVFATLFLLPAYKLVIASHQNTSTRKVTKKGDRFSAAAPSVK